jgi:predicted DNA-binding ribbon-helix-helix protein
LSHLEHIEASTIVKDIIESFPELTDYFLNLGICGCGYKEESDYYWTIERVANEKKLNLAKLLEELNKKIKD